MIRIYCTLIISAFINCSVMKSQYIKPFAPPVSFEKADERASAILQQMSLEDKILLIGGHNMFFVKGFEKYNIPQLYLSDATQGVHIRKELSNLMEKSTAFPCPIALTATWNPDLAKEYARCIGEECRASDVAVLLGPGMNIYRISQNGRNFEYFGEDPYLAARMIKNYVAGVQSTGTIATLKHFLCNNSDYYRRTTNVIVDERTLHEIYLPAFKAGIDAGAMAVMTSYNQVNGEWTGQSDYVINNLLRKQLGFKWLVMTDWWSVWDAQKVIKSGQDLEMPGDPRSWAKPDEPFKDANIKKNALQLVKEGKVSEAEINRMAKSILRTSIAMGLFDRPVKDLSLLANLPEHEKIALQTAREAIVLLKNEGNILPLSKQTGKILLTGNFVKELARGLGSAEVLGYNNVTMLDALKQEFGDQLECVAEPTDKQIAEASVVLLSVGTLDSEGWDKPFEQPEIDKAVNNVVSKNPRTVVIVNAGGGIQMTSWAPKVAGIIYSWYVGQNGNIALAEIVSGKTNPSGKLPISIEKKFEDSPGFGYIPAGQKLYKGWNEDGNMANPIINCEYKEGVFVGYRWYEAKKIEPLFPFGFGLSYTGFEYKNLKLSKPASDNSVTVEFEIKNSGKVAGSEIAQVYVRDVKSSVPRPVKELKAFKKVMLKAGESIKVQLTLHKNDFAFWDVKSHQWIVEPGKFIISVGSSSKDILLSQQCKIKKE